MFDEQFEVMIQDPNGELCSYACLWVDNDTRSAFVEPVSTREKYRESVVWEKRCFWLYCIVVKKTALHVRMLNLLMYGENFYASAGFRTYGKMGIWTLSETI